MGVILQKKIIKSKDINDQLSVFIIFLVIFDKELMCIKSNK